MLRMGYNIKFIVVILRDAMYEIGTHSQLSLSHFVSGALQLTFNREWNSHPTARAHALQSH